MRLNKITNKYSKEELAQMKNGFINVRCEREGGYDVIDMRTLKQRLCNPIRKHLYFFSTTHMIISLNELSNLIKLGQVAE